MTSQKPTPNTIVFAGKKTAQSNAQLAEVNLQEASFSVAETFELDYSRSADTEPIVRTLEDNQYMEITFDDGSVWLGTNEEFSKIFGKESVSRSATVQGEDALNIPASIKSDDDTRGLLKTIVPKVLNILVKKTKVVEHSVLNLALKYENKALDEQEGIYFVDANFQLKEKFDIKKADADDSFLLFIHGTASSTIGSFAELRGKDQSNFWPSVRSKYNKNILGFQHRTLTKSPVENVYELIKQLPNKIKLDIVSHSRGGLVAELLVRFPEYNEGIAETFLMNSGLSKNDKKLIREIRTLILEKEIKVGTFVRVACPAGGTSLMGKRVEHYFNVLINLFNFTVGLVAYPPLITILKELILEVVSQKNQPEVLPGLQAMDPESDFIKLVNSPVQTDDQRIIGMDGQLIVISGSSKLNKKLKGLELLMSQLLFLDRNDFVVNTKSMYYCTPRKSKTLYLLDEGEGVNHFNYFKNEKTQNALKNALTLPLAQLNDFKTYIGNANDEEVRGLEGGNVFKNDVSGKRSIVILLPGIMGSTLEIDNKRFWIDYLKILKGSLTKLALDKHFNVRPAGLIATSYKKLVDFLSLEYDVVTFPYDWRKSVTESGTTLIKQVKEYLLKLEYNNNTNNVNNSVHIIAHSMGGLVAREIALQDKPLWDTLNKQSKFRFILLGTPWLGSYRISYVLAGRDSLVKKIAKLDLMHNKASLVDMFSKYIGLLQLLPLGDGSKHDFADEKVWKDFVRLLDIKWEIPGAELRKIIKEYRAHVLPGLEAINYDNIIYVAGKDDQTQCNYFEFNGKLEFENTVRGDQSVTWDSGIPKQVLAKGKDLYYVDVTHGALACERKMFNGIHELLKNGSTNDIFFRSSESTRGLKESITTFIDKEQEVVYVEEGNITTDLLGIPGEEHTEEELPTLRISILNADMKMSTAPLIIGHFSRDGILRTEEAADKYLDGAISTKYHLGVYPDSINTHELFLTDDKNPFKGAIVVGLGEVEEFTPQHLSHTIEKACISYMLKADAGKTSLKISSLFIGSNYGQLSVGGSIMAILQGVQAANFKMRNIDGSRPLIEEVELIELYEDKAIAAYQFVKGLIDQNYENISVKLQENRVVPKFGRRKRLVVDTGSDWWQRISIKSDFNPENQMISMEFSSSTTSAREERLSVNVDLNLFRSILKDISDNRRWNSEDASLIYEMLIPNGFKENLSNRDSLLFVVDEMSAAFPWELLQPGISKSKPLCVNSKLIRQLNTGSFKSNPLITKSNSVLIIGDPDLEGAKFASQLNSAEDEANRVYEMLNQKLGDKTEILVKKNAVEIVRKLVNTDCKILHIAAHAVFYPDKKHQSGIIIGKSVHDGKDVPRLITADFIEQLSHIPELVFINSCFSGSVEMPGAQEGGSSKAELAANIGIKWINKGAKAVVITGWEVNDAPAYKFAEVFYAGMTAGMDFGTAIRYARSEVFTLFPSSNTWGAYQCYGDPFYKLNFSSSKSTQKISPFNLEQEALNELDSLKSKIEIDFYSRDELFEMLSVLEKRLNKSDFDLKTKIKSGIVEKMALIYFNLNKDEEAERWFEILLNSQNTSFEIHTLERYLSIKNKNLLNKFLANSNDKELMSTIIKEFADLIEKAESVAKIVKTAAFFIQLGNIYKTRAIIEKEKERKIILLEESFDAYNKIEMAEGLNHRWFQAEYNKILVKNIIRMYDSKYKFSADMRKIKFTDFEKQFEEYAKQRMKISNAEEEYWERFKEVVLPLTKLVAQWNKLKVDEKESLKNKLIEDYQSVLKLGTAFYRKDLQLKYLNIIVNLIEGAGDAGKELADLLGEIRDKI